MRKVPTVYRRDPDNRARVVNEVADGCEWVLAGEGRATRKWDGTCVMSDGQRWWARREVKPGKPQPEGYILLAADTVTGKRVGWEPAEQSGYAAMLADAVRHQRRCNDLTYKVGTFELVGPKINGNPEEVSAPMLLRHGTLEVRAPRDFDGLAVWLAEFDGEGIVWHHADGRMAKLKRKDFA